MSAKWTIQIMRIIGQLRLILMNMGHRLMTYTMQLIPKIISNPLFSYIPCLYSFSDNTFDKISLMEWMWAVCKNLSTNLQQLPHKDYDILSYLIWGYYRCSKEKTKYLGLRSPSPWAFKDTWIYWRNLGLGSERPKH